MGTINYGTSEYITVGLEPYDFADYENESGECDYDARCTDMRMDCAYVENILARYDFFYFDIRVKPGYYEGFYIDIESNFGLAYDSWEDKREALKEATQIKRFLLECVESCCCVVHPGWCTGYEGEDESKASIAAAIAEMKNDIRQALTWTSAARRGIEI